MMDLPVALLSATAIVLATRAFRDWLWRDLALCSLFLGLALTAKHSAPVVLLTIGAIGVFLAFWLPATAASNAPPRARLRILCQRLLKVAAVTAGALLVLWGSYLFRYRESPAPQETFNRPLADKIKDVDTPMYHSVLATMAATHIVPRAYLWGFADTIRAGMEGRPFPQVVFGRVYIRKGPAYFFPAMIAVKLPIGLSFLVLLGLFLFFARRLPPDWNLPASIILAAAILFLLVLAKGRHLCGHPPRLASRSFALRLRGAFRRKRLRISFQGPASRRRHRLSPGNHFGGSRHAPLGVFQRICRRPAKRHQIFR